MANNRTRYPYFRHVMVARYGHFRIDRVWTRYRSTAEEEYPRYYVVFEVDAHSEFTLDYVPPLAAVPSVMLRNTIDWLRDHRPTPMDGGVESIACYRRRVGPPDGEHEATPGGWFQDPDFRRPGRPMIDMSEAVPLVEAALHDLEAAEAGGTA